ncbi:MAG: oligosaccharide flippase family protein [Cellulosilyticaceae bacterium]
MKSSQLKAGAILSYISLFISNIVGILYTPIMLRLMGPSEYGLYSLVATVVGYLTVLDMGLGNAIVRYIAKYRTLDDKEGEYSLNGMFLCLYTLIGILAAGIGVVLCLNVENLFGSSLSARELEKAKVMMGLLVFNLSITFPLGVFGAIMNAYERFVFPKIVNIIRVIINPCIMLPLLLIGYRSVTMVLVTTLLNIICLLINVWYCFKKLHIKIHFTNFQWGLLKEIGRYSFFIFLNIIVDKIYWSTDQFILGMFSGTVMVAIYAVASQLSMYYMSFSTAISGVFLPRVTQMVTQNVKDKELSDMFIKTGRIQYIIMAYILSGFLLVGKDFIRLWAGEGYESAFLIAIVIMIPLTVPLIQNLGITILQAKNLHAFRSNIYIIIAILNLGMSIPLAKIWGGIGCALATGISLTIGNIIIINIYYWKRINLDIPRFWLNICKMSVPVVIALGIGIGANYCFKMTGFMKIITTGSLFTLVYIPLMWFLGMNIYERKLFLGPIKAVGRKLSIVR